VFCVLSFMPNQAKFKYMANLRTGRTNLSYTVQDVKWHPQECRCVDLLWFW
jgi:hypothetical protein